MRSKQETEISGFTYEVTQLGARVATNCAFRLSKMLGPMMISGRPEVSSVMASLHYADQADFEFWRDTMVSEIAIVRILDNGGGKSTRTFEPLKASFDEHFAGRTADLFKLLFFASKVNFADFFSAWESVAREMSAKANASPPPQASSGSSGESSSPTISASH